MHSGVRMRTLPSYREQNYINWSITERLCREGVAKYKRKWSRREKVYRRKSIE